jgi:hypothetical protein
MSFFMCVVKDQAYRLAGCNITIAKQHGAGSGSTYVFNQFALAVTAQNCNHNFTFDRKTT